MSEAFSSEDEACLRELIADRDQSLELEVGTDVLDAIERMLRRSDRDTIAAILDRAGIPYVEDDDFTPPNTVSIVAPMKEDQEKVVGYQDFRTDITFDDKGNLIEWGCWE